MIALPPFLEKQLDNLPLVTQIEARIQLIKTYADFDKELSQQIIERLDKCTQN